MFDDNDIHMFNEENDENVVDYIRLIDYIDGVDQQGGDHQPLSTDAYYCTGGEI